MFSVIVIFFFSCPQREIKVQKLRTKPSFAFNTHVFAPLFVMREFEFVVTTLQATLPQKQKPSLKHTKELILPIRTVKIHEKTCENGH